MHHWGLTGSKRVTDRKYWNVADEPRCRNPPLSVCSLRNYCLAGGVEGTVGSIPASGLPHDPSDRLSSFAALSIPQRLKGRSLNLQQMTGCHCAFVMCVRVRMVCMYVHGRWVGELQSSHGQRDVFLVEYSCPERRAVFEPREGIRANRHKKSKNLKVEMVSWHSSGFKAYWLSACVLTTHHACVHILQIPQQQQHLSM